jgi:hypothetical protein
VESYERSFKKTIHHLVMAASTRWPPKRVAGTPGSHRRQAVESYERYFKKTIHHLVMAALTRCLPKRVAATPGSHRRQAVESYLRTLDAWNLGGRSRCKRLPYIQKPVGPLGFKSGLAGC